jgi:hypothetical protein
MNHKEIEEAKKKIDSFTSIPKRIRLEQIIHYEVVSDEFDLVKINV